ncbi:thioredoxin-like protein [Fomitiporia mediterranea MF3/22]|uniref:thioredoxin-like protein n=1 Tax=Fomitiporia mediterranea (strain MF3/22) TaxID=694068 RepID=UPI0004407B5B|nr:thioredoxin-like protein [Fomitiporia mediterranea MF3/22]EJD02673.1 thioredoxin-like protein [Fomitiporia mediterranea MF3/22]
MPASFGGIKPYGPEDELRDLLHMVASSELTIPSDVDPSKPLSRDVYSVDLGNVAWLQEVQADPPVIVFSKTYCKFSAAAKDLLKTYDLSPPPKVVEVDLRSDSDQLKAILTRLTSHSTFPNIFIDGESIGGFDDLSKLNKNGELVTLLSNAGVSSNVNGESEAPSPKDE